jgi:hypothetical protein
MKKLTFISIVFLALHLAGNGQKTQFGFTAGTAIANYHSKSDGQTDNGNSKIGLTAGIIADIPTGKHLSFQPAINFVQKGTKDEQTIGGITEKAKLNVNCIELPLNLLYNSNGSNSNFFVGAGPSLALSISGKAKYEDNNSSFSGKINFGNTDNDDMRGLDFGANFLAGFRFHRGLLFSVNYNAGLSNLFPGGSSNDKMKSNYFGIRLGYLLNKKTKD